MLKKVAIVEDDRGLREQLAQILGAARDARFVGACASGEEALDRIHVLQPDVVLMDIKLPGMSGIECVAHLKRALPSLQIIMLTVYEDSERIFRALKAGADGREEHLRKDARPEPRRSCGQARRQGHLTQSAASRTGKSSIRGNPGFHSGLVLSCLRR